MTKWLALLALPVAALVPACKDGTNSIAPAVTPGETSAPAVRILAKGGASEAESDEYSGGRGGAVEVLNRDGTGIHILKTGTVNAFVEVPDVVPSLGANPRTIAADAVLSPSDGNMLEPGLILGDDGMTPATGLWVKPGVTLTLNPNIYDSSFYAPWWGEYGYLYHTVWMHFSDGVFIEGTIRVGRKTALFEGPPPYVMDTAADVDIDALNLVVATTGEIDLKGSPDSLADYDQAVFGREQGGYGGQLDAHIEGTIVVKGTIDTSGGSGPNGGHAGHVFLTSSGYGVFTTGTIRADGGEGTSDAGGNGYRQASYFSWDNGFFKPAGAPSKVLQYGYDYPTILLASGSIGAVNTGTLSARGGTGMLYGGRGGSIVLDAGRGGAPKALAGPAIVEYPAVATSGSLDASGGNSIAGTDFDSYAGAGGSIHIVGDIYRVSGSLVARGGNAYAGGGWGGEVIIGPNPWGNTKALADAIATANPYGDNAVGANIDVTGGLTKEYDNGGDGGYVYIESNLSVPVPCAELYLVNYELIDVSGGDGRVYGGTGGRLTVTNGDGPGKATLAEATAGTELHDGFLENEVAIAARGGNSAYSNAGIAGDVYFYNTSTYSKRSLVNSGEIDARGGDGAYGGSGEDSVIFYCLGDLTNTATIDVSGGKGYWTGGSAGQIDLMSTAKLVNSGRLASEGGLAEYQYAGSGGNGGGLYLDAGLMGNVQNSGTLSVAGGDSNGQQGGWGGEIGINGLTASTTGTLDASGGNARADYASSVGGAGGSIGVTSLQPSSSIGSTLDVGGGTGETHGIIGSIWIDGIQTVGP